MARGEVRYRLVLDSKPFTDGIKAAKTEANSMANDLSSKLGKAGSALSSMGPAGLAAAAGIGAFAGAAGLAIKATIEAVSAAAKYADTLAALEDKTGLSSKALQDLEIAAKLGNTSLEAIASSVNKMQVNLINGASAFGKLGLSIRDLKALAPEQQLKAVAQAILNLGTAAERSTAMREIFGRGGTEMVGALKAMASGATELGGALGGDALKAAAELQDQMDLLGFAVDRVKLQFGAAVAQSPELQDALKDLTRLAADFAETIAKATPRIVNFFNSLVAGARAAKAGLAGGIGAFSGSFFGAASEAGMREQIRKWRDEVGFGKAPSAGAGTFRGAADDASVKEAARAAEQTRAAWQKASEDARAAWDKFYDMMRDRSGDMLQDQKKVIAQMAKDHTARVMQQLEDQKNLEEAEQRIIEETKRRQFEQNQEMVRGLTAVSLALEDLGRSAGGAFGILLGLGGAAVQVFANLKDKALQAASTTQKLAGAISAAASIMSGPGGAKGAMSGAATGAMAGSAWGPWGALIGGVGGAILGLFGGPSKEEKQAEQQKQIKETIGKMEDLLQRAKAIKMDQLTAGVGGLAAMFAHLGTKTDETGERFRRLEFFGAALFKSLKEEGLSSAEAFKVMGPALDQAIAAAKANGQELSGLLGSLAAFRELVMANEGLVAAVDGFNDLVTAVGVTRETMQHIQPEMQAFFDEMIAKGFTADQALGELAPTLFAIREAARAGRIEVDAATAALIAQAEAGGHFDNLKDPMKELVEIQKMMLELWAAIAHMQGVTLPESLRKYIEEINRARAAVPGVPVPPGGPSGGAGFPEEPGQPGNASGGLHTILGNGPLRGGGTPLVGHPGEEAYIGRPRGFAGGIGPIVLEVDGRELGRVHIENLRKNRAGLRSQSSRYVG